jgi:hypothetical protein
MGKVIIPWLVIVGLASIVWVTTIILFSTKTQKPASSYGIVVNAALFGTRVVIYKWYTMDDYPTGIVSEVMTCDIDGGITNLPSQDYQASCTYLDPCFQEAMINISVSTKETSQTVIPVFFAATEEVRRELTKKNATSNILESIQQYISGVTLDKPNFKYLKASPDLVSFISEKDERFYTWLGANYLTGSLFPSLKRPFFAWIKENKWFESTVTGTLKTHAVLDLGEFSNQNFVFEVNDINDNDVVSPQLFGKKYSVYSQNIFCFSMDQARRRHQRRLIQQNKTVNGRSHVLEDPCMPKGTWMSLPGKLFSEACLQINSHNAELKKIDEVKTYHFDGTSNVEECRSQVHEMLDLKTCQAEFKVCFDLNINSSKIMSSKKFMAISRFYEQSTILKNLKDGSISQEDFEREGKDLCNSNHGKVLEYHPNVRIQMAKGYCFGHQYIQLTLTSIYQIHGERFKDIIFTKKINDRPFDWTLGLMVNATNLLKESTKPTSIVPFPVFIILLIISFIAAVGGIAFAVRSRRVRNSLSLESSSAYTSSVNVLPDTGSTTITDIVSGKQSHAPNAS